MNDISTSKGPKQRWKRALKHSQWMASTMLKRWDLRVVRVISKIGHRCQASRADQANIHPSPDQFPCQFAGVTSPSIRRVKRIADKRQLHRRSTQTPAAASTISAPSATSETTIPAANPGGV